MGSEDDFPFGIHDCQGLGIANHPSNIGSEKKPKDAEGMIGLNKDGVFNHNVAIPIINQVYRYTPNIFGMMKIAPPHGWFLGWFTTSIIFQQRSMSLISQGHDHPDHSHIVLDILYINPYHSILHTLHCIVLHYITCM